MSKYMRDIYSDDDSEVEFSSESSSSPPKNINKKKRTIIDDDDCTDFLDNNSLSNPRGALLSSLGATINTTHLNINPVQSEIKSDFSNPSTHDSYLSINSQDLTESNTTDSEKPTKKKTNRPSTRTQKSPNKINKTNKPNNTNKTTKTQTSNELVDEAENTLLVDASSLLNVPDQNTLLSFPPLPPSSAPMLNDATQSILTPLTVSKANNSDTSPLAVSSELDWSQIGGLKNHITALHEMVVMPLLYPQLFKQFGLSPPKGVLFTGPPGTGKTLTARTLAATCSKASGRKVSFFLRKGADCLSKWVGEAERQLRLLFEEAKKHQPSIIFFDEIDGLAPVRSSSQDQVHSSIVATLLALMDGLDGRGEVIVIGATNRVDSIDPALRRPGRFDRELLFSLPDEASRRDILNIYTSKWQTRVSEAQLISLSKKTVGYGGADLKLLCTEAALSAIKRQMPQLYDVSAGVPGGGNDGGEIIVSESDFTTALNRITPSSLRHSTSLFTSNALANSDSTVLKPRVDVFLKTVHDKIRIVFPSYIVSQASLVSGSAVSVPSISTPPSHARVILHGRTGNLTHTLLQRVLLQFEEYPVSQLNIASVFADTGSTEQNIINIITEAKRNAPSILLISDIELVYASLSENNQYLLLELLRNTSSNILVIASFPLDKLHPTPSPFSPTSTSTSTPFDTSHLISLLPHLAQPLFDPTFNSLCCIDMDEMVSANIVYNWLVTESVRIFDQQLITHRAIEVELLKKKAQKIVDGNNNSNSNDTSLHSSKSSLEIKSIPKTPNPRTPRISRYDTQPSSLKSPFATLSLARYKHIEVLLLHLRIFLRSTVTYVMALYKDFIAPSIGSRVGGFWLRDVLVKVNESQYYSIQEFLIDIDRIVSDTKLVYDYSNPSYRTLVSRVCQMQDEVFVLCLGFDRNVSLACEVIAKFLRQNNILRWPSLLYYSDANERGDDRKVGEILFGHNTQLDNESDSDSDDDRRIVRTPKNNHTFKGVSGVFIKDSDIPSSSLSSTESTESDVSDSSLGALMTTSNFNTLQTVLRKWVDNHSQNSTLSYQTCEVMLASIAGIMFQSLEKQYRKQLKQSLNSKNKQRKNSEIYVEVSIEGVVQKIVVSISKLFSSSTSTDDQMTDTDHISQDKLYNSISDNSRGDTNQEKKIESKKPKPTVTSMINSDESLLKGDKLKDKKQTVFEKSSDHLHSLDALFSSIPTSLSKSDIINTSKTDHSKFDSSRKDQLPYKTSKTSKTSTPDFKPDNNISKKMKKDRKDNFLNLKHGEEAKKRKLDKSIDQCEKNKNKKHRSL